MKVIGIIAEYNPFHNGHAYQIAEVKKRTGADFAVIAMSGDFMQRGAPAVIDKYARARMALCCGADLVFELPSLWTVSSAELFAAAGISLFEKMGCVDGICFGAETENLPLLSFAADILAQEPDDYRTALSSYLKTGMNFPAARLQALCDVFSAETAANPKLYAQFSSITKEELSALLGTPNNILAIEYLKALKRRHSSIRPILLKREGAGYHDAMILPETDPAVPTASASAIRALILQNAADTCKHAIPQAAYAILAEYLAAQPALDADDLSPLLGYRLLSCSKDALTHIYDNTPELANRIFKNRYAFVSFSQFCALNKSREITYTRISRILTHLVLNMTDSDFALGKQLDFIPYLRVLGFRQDAAPLFSLLKKMQPCQSSQNFPLHPPFCPQMPCNYSKRICLLRNYMGNSKREKHKLAFPAVN